MVDHYVNMILRHGLTDQLLPPVVVVVQGAPASHPSAERERSCCSKRRKSGCAKPTRLVAMPIGWSEQTVEQTCWEASRGLLWKVGVSEWMGTWDGLSVSLVARGALEVFPCLVGHVLMAV